MRHSPHSTTRPTHLGARDALETVRTDFEDTVSAAQVETIVRDLKSAIEGLLAEVRHVLPAAQGD